VPRLRDLDRATMSPYLAQHVDNPVEWWAWGPDALAEARRLDRPVFLSVGYAACHWCHVMAHESFEDPAIAARLNAAFLPVKVDREERPDLDELYMAATQLMSGHGGWPMSVFTLPDGSPFLAGTYYPPVDRGGQVGFSRLLDALADAWATQRPSVVAQARQVADSLARESALIDHLSPPSGALDLGAVRVRLRDELRERCDTWGGFSPAPKFPRPSYVLALVDGGDEGHRAAAARTLDAMSRGGLYDHLAGGFARYSVDARWEVPHFEKMLCDQGLLARAFLLADRAVGGSSPWRTVALETLGFVRRDLAVEGGLAASLDADAGGVEGGHVTWSLDEVDRALDIAGLADLRPAVVARWRLDEPVFEGRAVPRLAEGVTFATPPELAGARDALLSARAARPQPARDHKVILEWNAMAISAMLLSRDAGLEAEGRARLDGLWATHRDDGGFWRTRKGEARATAADLAWTCDALVDAFEVDGDDRHLERAREVAEELLAHHWDGERPSARAPATGRALFATSDLAGDLPLRPKEILDGATPSAHAVATRALARLGALLGDADLETIADRLVELGAPLLAEHPLAVPDLVEAAGFVRDRVEAVVPGPPNPLSALLRSRAMFRSLLVTGSGGSPLLAGRESGLAYLCRGGVCDLPVADVDTLRARLDAEGR
jgi:uncharacterized protein YyaL (SSP411 family)